MCGIFGIVASSASRQIELAPAVTTLFRLSESRGREASGLASMTSDRIVVLKSPERASCLVRSRAYFSVFEQPAKGTVAIIGHSRLVTNGSQQRHANNQPVVAGRAAGVHNGIVVNDAELWERFPSVHRQHEVDTEVLLALLRHFFDQSQSIVQSVREVFSLARGAVSIAAALDDLHALILATNNGSLYLVSAGTDHAFASEELILQRFIASRSGRRWTNAPIQQVRPGTGRVIDLSSSAITEFALNGADHVSSPLAVGDGRAIVDVSPSSAAYEQAPFVSAGHARRHEALVDRHRNAVASLRRCTRCILPETVPFIEFNAGGVCSFCANHQPLQLAAAGALEAEIQRRGKAAGRPDCIVAISGGRDSTYGLHYLKKELGLTPIAFTYDWGMVTDLARRNMSRQCGDLGVEHIVISADISRKRDNIRRNVTAWLKRPSLGLVPLFMAGDKQFLYLSHRLKKQLSIDTLVICDNLLEKTTFKSGFCGLPPRFATSGPNVLPWADRARMPLFYLRQFAANPSYLNRSLVDTIAAFGSYYVMPHDFVSLYRYVPWREADITSAIDREYGWERAADTRNTWRIGDGTASFYNYIYYVMAGFTENDTFRSNQVREGMLLRDDALAMANEDNAPRWESIRWYCDTIGLRAPEVLDTIHAAPPLDRIAALR